MSRSADSRLHATSPLPASSSISADADFTWTAEVVEARRWCLSPDWISMDH